MSDLLQVRNPRSGDYDYQIQKTDAAAIATLANELRANQPGWKQRGIDGRIECMQRWKQALLQHGKDITAAIATDTGRNALARSELAGVTASIDRWCEIAPTLLQTQERAAQTMPEVALRQQPDPYPLLGVISPWNFPLLLSFIDAIPALLAGCAVIIKPSEITPRFAEPVTESIAAVPELHNILRFISGDGQSGAALIPEADVVAFTGSVATGKKVAAAAAEAFIPAFLELGGKDPVVLLDGCDIDRAATAVLRASVAATGQACQSLERIYVHSRQHDNFVHCLSEKAAATELSYPDPDSGIVGPLIFERQADIIRQHLDDAVAKGAVIHTGGNILELGGGLWAEPTVISQVNHSMQLMTEETFGPVMPVMAYDTVDQAVALANDTQYGLSAAVMGGSEQDALRVAARIDAGGISINDAGLTALIFEERKSAFKCSGMGPSRVGDSGLTRFLRNKALLINRGTVLPIEVFAETP